jgi:hypothetical protein
LQGKFFFVMEGARLGSVVFKALCLQILGPGPWDQCMVPAQDPWYGVRHFVDADPTPWPCWLEYLRSGEVPFVEAGPLRERVTCDSERAGLAELAERLGQLADWLRHKLQALLARKTVVNLHGARLRCQDLSNLGFAKCSLRRADLSDCTLSGCSFEGAELREADLQRVWFLQCDLWGTDLRAANLRGATLPPWSSGLMEGVKLAGATGWVPADRDLRQAKFKDTELEGAYLEVVNLSNADLKGVNLAGATLPWSSGLKKGREARRGDGVGAGGQGPARGEAQGRRPAGRRPAGRESEQCRPVGRRLEAQQHEHLRPERGEAHRRRPVGLQSRRRHPAAVEQRADGGREACRGDGVGAGGQGPAQGEAQGRRPGGRRLGGRESERH